MFEEDESSKDERDVGAGVRGGKERVVVVVVVVVVVLDVGTFVRSERSVFRLRLGRRSARMRREGFSFFSSSSSSSSSARAYFVFLPYIIIVVIIQILFTTTTTTTNERTNFFLLQILSYEYTIPLRR